VLVAAGIRAPPTIAGESPPHDQHRVLSTTGSKLSSIFFCDRHEARVSGSRHGHDTDCGVVRERRVFGGPAISRDESMSHSRSGNTGRRSCTRCRPDGTNARMVTDSLDLQGAPAWAPDGQSITSARTITASHTFSGAGRRSSPLFLSRSTRSIPRGARRPLRCLLGPTSVLRFRESRHGGGRSAYPAGPDPNSGGSAPDLPARRTGTRGLRGEINIRISGYRTRRRVPTAVDQPQSDSTFATSTSPRRP